MFVLYLSSCCIEFYCFVGLCSNARLCDNRDHKTWIGVSVSGASTGWGVLKFQVCMAVGFQLGTVISVKMNTNNAVTVLMI